MSVEPGVRADIVLAPRGWRKVRGMLLRVGTFSLVELQKLQHDRT